MKMPQMNKI